MKSINEINQYNCAAKLDYDENIQTYSYGNKFVNSSQNFLNNYNISNSNVMNNCIISNNNNANSINGYNSIYNNNNNSNCHAALLSDNNISNIHYDSMSTYKNNFTPSISQSIEANISSTCSNVATFKQYAKKLRKNNKHSSIC